MEALPVSTIGLCWGTGSFVYVCSHVRLAFPKCFSCVFFRYEWLAEEELGEAVEATEAQGGTRFLEPPWKLVLSNKALLAVMWCVLFY